MGLQIDGIIFSLQKHGGISVYFRELLNGLDRWAEPYVLTLESPAVQDTSGLSSRADAILARPARRLERIRRCRPAPGVSLFHSSYYRLPADKRLPSVVTVHDFIHERFRHGWSRRAHMMQKHAAIKAAQAVICISNATRDDLLDWVGETPGQQIHVIHNGVSDVFRPLPPSAPARPYLLFVGERAGYKNFSLVLSALARLPDLELHCVGGGPLRADELDAASPEVRARVKHLGYVTDEALNVHYNRAACLAYPSAYEGFGIPVLEAMRAGCPVVSLDCKAVREVGGDALTVAEEASAEALVRAITSTLDVNRRATVVQAGHRTAARFGWQATHRQTLEVYRSLGMGSAPIPSRGGRAEPKEAR
jgi:mannosyltransferase